MPQVPEGQSSLDASQNEPLSDDALKMLRAIARDKPSVFRKWTGAQGPNCWLFLIPKNVLKASFIFQLAELNFKGSMYIYYKPPTFTLPTLEKLAYLMPCLAGVMGAITHFCKALIGEMDLEVCLLHILT